MDGIFLYWLPLAFCSIGYTLRTWKNYQNDVECRNAYHRDACLARADPKHNIYVPYHPTDTVGTLIGRLIAAITPGFNLLSGVFDVAPELFGSFFKFIDKVFDRPLVPK